MTSLADLPLIASGKVREMYALSEAEQPGGDDQLLMVASDRISTYDAVHPTPIPDKGKVLTGLSVFWFERTSRIVANHMLSTVEGVPEEALGRALVVRKLKMLPVECVVRGYITGSGWKDYQATGSVSGIELPAGLRESERLPEPIFTPSTKADEGHDEAIDLARATELVGDGELMARVRDVSIELYSLRRRACAQTRRDPRRHEVRVRPGRRGSSWSSATRCSRPTPRATGRPTAIQPGRPQPSFDKQYVRDWAASSGWDKRPPAPALPDDVVAGTRARYVQAYELLTGEPFGEWLARTGVAVA